MTGWIGRVRLGPVAALLMGGAGAFLVWAVPAELIGAVMRHLRVIAVLPQAAPPYSSLTRLLLALAAGVGLAAVVWIGFQKLETGEWPWSGLFEEDAEEEYESPLPRLRRGDRHPDAPARRPLFAGELLLHEPFPGETPAEPATDLALIDAPAPTITRAPLFADPVGVPEPEPQPEPQPEPLDVIAPEALVAEAEPVEDIADPADPIEIEPVAVRSLIAQAAPPAPIAGASLAELMARLEAGLARRDAAILPDTAPVPLGDALRDALADLQKMARR